MSLISTENQLRAETAIKTMSCDTSADLRRYYCACREMGARVDAGLLTYAEALRAVYAV